LDPLKYLVERPATTCIIRRRKSLNGRSSSSYSLIKKSLPKPFNEDRIVHPHEIMSKMIAKWRLVIETNLNEIVRDLVKADITRSHEVGINKWASVMASNGVYLTQQELNMLMTMASLTNN
jgi:hypothetical protein